MKEFLARYFSPTKLYIDVDSFVSCDEDEHRLMEQAMAEGFVDGTMNGLKLTAKGLDLFTPQPIPMEYYVLKVGDNYVTIGGMTTRFQTLAKTFISEVAASQWATRKAAGLAWSVEKLTA